jgi:hypothetical protein
LLFVQDTFLLLAAKLLLRRSFWPNSFTLVIWTGFIILQKLAERPRKLGLWPYKIDYTERGGTADTYNHTILGLDPIFADFTSMQPLSSCKPLSIINWSTYARCGMKPKVAW